MRSVGGPVHGSIEPPLDTDWFKVSLTAGQTYQFDLKGADGGGGTLPGDDGGVSKHQTVGGDAGFMGPDTQLVGPGRVGRGATIGAGSTITKDVQPDVLAVCRAKDQKHYASWKRPQKK